LSQSDRTGNHGNPKNSQYPLHHTPFLPATDKDNIELPDRLSEFRVGHRLFGSCAPFQISISEAAQGGVKRTCELNHRYITASVVRVRM
jgi:hypothetical protein